MRTAQFTPRFERDVRACERKHWNMDALRRAMSALLESDGSALDPRLRDHALAGRWQGYRSLHVDSAPNPPRDQWVLMYKVVDARIIFVRTGTHASVYVKG